MRPTAELGLDDHHQGIVKSYIQFARYLRTQNLKAIDMCIQDIADTRLLDATYTQGEVTEILRELQVLIHSDVETELISLAHTSALLLAQVLAQADKWHLRVLVNLSEIQNREMLEHVKAMEASDLGSKLKLEPLNNEDGSSQLLRIEIERLQAENQQLEEKFKHFENQIIQLKEDRNKLIGLVEKKDERITHLTHELQQLTTMTNNDQTTATPQIEKQDPEHLLSQYEKVLSEQLSSEMQTVQSQLALAQQELEKKFNQTAAYMNMKKMIGRKNDQVRELRKKLLKYEPQETGDSD
ncbi:leucine zipper transcription factor-like protein 1 [Macrosteles quadrilineatus]|uniref:leucine zipper transcription factor-like protein 1 n=1 Tax=Macrosteles quadrilineatus TaxID=74068 RepID=UPI0023E0CFD4|nr:leucine zipper transcription factor-like protein 1 [Macrosteles quadrilineatus]